MHPGIKVSLESSHSIPLAQNQCDHDSPISEPGQQPRLQAQPQFASKGEKMENMTCKWLFDSLGFLRGGGKDTEPYNLTVTYHTFKLKCNAN